MLKHYYRISSFCYLFLLSTFLMTGCSSSQTLEDEQASEDDAAFAEQTDSDTDNVPKDSAEQPAEANTTGSDAQAATSENKNASNAAAETPADTTASAQTTTATPATPEAQTSAAAVAAPAEQNTTNNANTAVATAAAPPPAAAASGNGEYSVQAGDTLMQIAYRHYGDIQKWKDIYEANRDKISNPNKIEKGMVLKLDNSQSSAVEEPSGEKYLIQQGDTLVKISQKLYGDASKWKKLWKHNPRLIKNPNKIFAGFYLYYIPESGSSGEPNTPAAPEGSAPAPAPAPVSTAPTNELPPMPPMPSMNETTAVTPSTDTAAPPAPISPEAAPAPSTP